MHFLTHSARPWAIQRLVQRVLLGLALTGAGLACLPAMGQNLLSSHDILAKLKTPFFDDDDQGGLPSKAFGPRPDPITRLCEPRPASMGANNEAGSESFRNLVVRPTPKVDLSVEFDFGKATLRPEGRLQLDALASALNDPLLVKTQFTLAGHTDAVGAADANNRLSCERALATKSYLLENHHIAAQRLLAMGMGFSRPLDRADPRAAVNRRVEVKILPEK